MNITISCCPNKSYNVPGEIFPFAVKGEAKYVFDLSHVEKPTWLEGEWLPLWMNNLKAFPIYICLKIYPDWNDEFKKNCKKFGMKYRQLSEGNRFFLSVTEVININQFKQILPMILPLGSEGNEVIWSTNKDVFNIGKKEWVGSWEGRISTTIIVKTASGSNIFWIGDDGDSLNVISNHQQFSSYNKICETLPDLIRPTQSEYAE